MTKNSDFINTHNQEVTPETLMEEMMRLSQHKSNRMSYSTTYTKTKKTSLEISQKKTLPISKQSQT